MVMMLTSVPDAVGKYDPKRNDRQSTEVHLRSHLLVGLLELRHPRTIVALATSGLARSRGHDVRCGREQILTRLRIVVVLGAGTHIMCVCMHNPR